eukprot:1147041-Pelagomonas_calceolata.AAC.4
MGPMCMQHFIFYRQQRTVYYKDLLSTTCVQGPSLAALHCLLLASAKLSMSAKVHHWDPITSSRLFGYTVDGGNDPSHVLPLAQAGKDLPVRATK